MVFLCLFFSVSLSLSVCVCVRSIYPTSVGSVALRLQWRENHSWCHHSTNAVRDATRCTQLARLIIFKRLQFRVVDQRPNNLVGLNYHRFGPPLACGGWTGLTISQCHKYNSLTRTWVQVSCTQHLQNLSLLLSDLVKSPLLWQRLDKCYLTVNYVH